MDLHEKLYHYCERAGDPAFWAEPINAFTNVAFLIAAALAARTFLRSPTEERGVIEALLIALVAAMGVGSFLFHTFATRWASFADTAPIGIFMIAYLAYTLRRYLGASWLVTVICLGGFLWALVVAEGMACTPPFLPITNATRGSCLNGTIGYVPALIALVLFAVVFAVQRHPVWTYFAAASLILALSMTFRTFDFEICDVTQLAGHHVGTHFLWHLLNATLLYMLLMGAIRHGSRAEAV